MTISSEINKSGPYNGNGSTTDFEFDFKICEPTHLLVLHTNSEGAETQLSADAYQVTQDEDGTGHITLPTALPNGEKITLLLNPPFTQLSDLPNQGAWNPEVVESALDKLTSCLLKLREEVSRSVKIKASNDLADLDDLLADIERLADASDGVKALAGVKAKLVECADNIASIQAATTSATNAANSAATALNAKTQAITAKDQSILAKTAAEAARDAALSTTPITASDKGRELVAKATEAEMRTVLGAASSAELTGKANASHNHSVGDLSDIHSNFDLTTGAFGGKQPSELGGASFLGFKFLTSTATHQLTAGTKFVRVIVMGGGGGCAYFSATAPGGNGGRVEGYVNTPEASLSVVVGASGGGRQVHQGSAYSGGTSSVGDLVANGGSGGRTQQGTTAYAGGTGGTSGGPSVEVSYQSYGKGSTNRNSPTGGPGCILVWEFG